MMKRLILTLALWSPAATWADVAQRLAPLPASQWRLEHAAHLLERAGFGGTPEAVRALHALGPQRAVERLVQGPGDSQPGPEFEHSGVFDPGLDPFPPSRPAATRLARANGEALGVRVKPGGDRPIQPVVNQFFYWLRASRLETDRVAYWWANRMLTSTYPLQEKMALFWHGHFACNEDKVRDYRKMLNQLQLFRHAGLGNFRTLLLGVARDPAMLAFLDAGVNVAGSPNENFAREIMELFTMGVGHYSETDVREAARAFTGWNFEGLEFHFEPARHDDDNKDFLGHHGRFSGEDIIDIILAQPATARFIAAKLYRQFVRDDLDPELASELGRRLAAMNYDLATYMTLLLRSHEFYSPKAIGSHIKSPVELVVSTYRKLGLTEVPGVPDFNVVTGALGQRLMHPPTVAGWGGGRSWITPSLLFERGNFVLDVVFPDIAFVPPDRYPSYGSPIIEVQARLRAGHSISSATRPPGSDGEQDTMAASNLLADRDEAFNTRYGSYRGWQMAIERVQPIPRRTAHLQLARTVLEAGATTPAEVVSHFEQRLFSVPLDAPTRADLAAFLERDLGTADIRAAATFLEEPLRVLLHLMLSLPEYQLG